MPTITSLHCPETIDQYSSFRQLLLFFDSLTQLQPAEDSKQTENPLVKAGMLEQYAPLPFGNDLVKFNRLIKDIRRHSPDFYGSSLSSLSSSPLPVDESSVKQLIAQMNPDTKSRENAQRTEETFLQARLLLRLAEIHENEEKELQEKIYSINLKEARLLTALKGGDEELSALINSQDMQMSAESPERFKRRLKAWAVLFLADQKEPPWLITMGPNDAFDLLKETIASKTRAEHLFTISLAGPIAEVQDDHKYAAFLADFQSKTETCRKTLFDQLKQTAETGIFHQDEKLAEALIKWEKTVQAIAANGTKKMAFYLFKMPFANLLVEGLSLKNAPPKKPLRQNAVLGVLL
jgi:hypothetical protein